MKTINLFNNGKTESNTAAKGSALAKVLPEKYCPNCGQKHQVRSEMVELEGFPKGCQHVKFFIECPDKEGPKTFVKFCPPVAQDVVFMSFFTFNLKDVA